MIYEEYQDLIGPPKPKMHFLTHYPRAIYLLGPPMSYWTARFESRHRLAKNAATSAKNFKNISLTISTRQQMRQSSVYYHGMFPTSKTLFLGETTYRGSLSGKSGLEQMVLPLMTEDDFLCAKIEFESQVYSKGQIVVLKQDDCDELKVGLIKSILIKDNKPLLVTKEFIVRRQPLQFFKGTSENDMLSLNQIENLADYKPLVNQGSSSELFFCLHHHLSYTRI